MLKKISVVLLITLTIVFSSVGVFASDVVGAPPAELPYMLPSLTWVQNEVEKAHPGSVKPMYYFTSFVNSNPKYLRIYASDKPFKFENSNVTVSNSNSIIYSNQTIYKNVYEVNSDRSFKAIRNVVFSKDFYSSSGAQGIDGVPQYTNHDIKIDGTNINFLPPQFNLNSTINQPMADLQKVFLRDFSTILEVGLAVLVSLLAVFLIRRLINWAVS